MVIVRLEGDVARMRDVPSGKLVRTNRRRE